MRGGGAPATARRAACFHRLCPYPGWSPARPRLYFRRLLGLAALVGLPVGRPVTATPQVRDRRVCRHSRTPLSANPRRRPTSSVYRPVLAPRGAYLAHRGALAARPVEYTQRCRGRPGGRRCGASPARRAARCRRRTRREPADLIRPSEHPGRVHRARCERLARRHAEHRAGERHHDGKRVAERASGIEIGRERHDRPAVDQRPGGRLRAAQVERRHREQHGADIACGERGDAGRTGCLEVVDRPRAELDRERDRARLGELVAVQPGDEAVARSPPRRYRSACSAEKAPRSRKTSACSAQPRAPRGSTSATAKSEILVGRAELGRHRVRSEIGRDRRDRVRARHSPKARELGLDGRGRSPTCPRPSSCRRRPSIPGGQRSRRPRRPRPGRGWPRRWRGSRRPTRGCARSRRPGRAGRTHPPGRRRTPGACGSRRGPGSRRPHRTPPVSRPPCARATSSGGPTAAIRPSTIAIEAGAVTSIRPRSEPRSGASHPAGDAAAVSPARRRLGPGLRRGHTPGSGRPRGVRTRRCTATARPRPAPHPSSTASGRRRGSRPGFRACRRS